MAVIEITKDNFEEEVLKSDKKVLVDFNANWCGPCQMLKPVVEEISNENEKVKVASINIDDEDELAENYNVSSIPCLVLFENGKETKRNVGFISKDDINSLIGE
ncbi:MAG: thioredoxin [Bacilli bacterium]|nr:thioredoxin [Bacilli bacterium]